MKHDSTHQKLDRKAFLADYQFTEKQFTETGIDWTLLGQIAQSHIALSDELQTTADYIVKRLQLVPAVHSLKVRIKHPEHLMAKLIRKKLADGTFSFTLESYETCITDLIGIRVLHLFKDEWASIHKFVTETWELNEQPIAYVRKGDPPELIQTFTDAKFNVQEHPFGYRSIHYLIKTQPSKYTRISELQVRTIFEEGWSEIDHRVRYPRQSDDPYLAQFLAIFNRLAGSADEMGTFIKGLSTYLAVQTEKMAESEVRLNKKEKELQLVVSNLKISEAEKEKLKQQISDLRKPSTITFGKVKFSNATELLASSLATGMPGFDPPATDWLGIGNAKICAACGTRFESNWGLGKCPKCHPT